MMKLHMQWLDEKEVWDKARIMQGIMPEPEEPAPEAAPSRQEATSSPQQATASGAPRADAGDAVQQGSAEDLEVTASQVPSICQAHTESRPALRLHPGTSWEACTARIQTSCMRSAVTSTQGSILACWCPHMQLCKPWRAVCKAGPMHAC